MPRTVVPGWSNYPAEKATSNGVFAGVFFGAGIALGLAGKSPSQEIGIVLAIVGAVLLMRSFEWAERLRDCLIVKPMLSPPPLVIIYTNWEGETGERTVIPQSFRYSTTEWHPDSQWLMDALDVDKDAKCTFALRDIQSIVG